MTKEIDGGSRSVERALKLVREIAVSEDGLTLTRAAQAVSLPTSTVARLLRSLEGAGFATRDEHGVYRPGVKVLQIGAIAVNKLTLDAVAEGHLQELADATGETAYLAVPDGPERAVYLNQVESPRAIRHATWTGRAIPTGGTAVGAALAGRFNEWGFVTSRGTAVEPDAAAAAAPIFGEDGKAIAAISIIGPSFRLDDELLHKYGEHVARHAGLITETLRLRRRGRHGEQGIGTPTSHSSNGG